MAITVPQPLNNFDLAKLEADTFKYFLHEMHPATGLVPDSTREGSPCSIAVVGFALTVYPIAVERSYLSRAEAIKRTRRKLRFFYNGPEGKGPDSIGCKGFYYHFLDMNNGRRVWNSEASTIDTAILIAGALTAAQYFDRDTAAEREIRKLADALYRRVDWQWAQNGGLTVTHGWKPETGFIKYRWTGYTEALILYILALASPTFPSFTRELSRLDQNLQVEKHLRLPISIRRSAFHSSAFAYVDRLSRNSG